MSTRTKASTGRGAVDSSSPSPDEKPSPSRREQRDNNKEPVRTAEEEETDDRSNTGNESPSRAPDDEEEEERGKEDNGEEEEDDEEDGSPSATGPASMGKSSHGGGSGGDVSAGRWTAREHDIFLRGLRDYGREWKKISQMIKSRTVVQIRTHAQKYFQKLARDGVEGADQPGHSSSSAATTNKSPTSSSGIRTPESEGKSSKKRHHDSRGYNKTSVSSASSSAIGNTSGLSHIASAAAYSNNGNGGYESKRLHIEPSKATTSSSSSSEGMWSPSGITPRTVAAATILVAPRVSPDSAWFARRQAMAMELLSQPRRTSPRLSNISTPPTWNGAAALHRVVVALPQQYPSPAHTPPPVSHHSM